MVTPAGESVLIDTGNPGGRDAGRIHDVATRVAGLQRIDHVLVTHLHVDHYGGAAELSRLMPLGIVHDNGIPDQDPDGRQDPTWPQRIRPYREMPVEGRRVVVAGEGIPLRQVAGGPEVDFRFLAARRKLAVPAAAATNITDCQDPAPKADDPSDNANSVVSLVRFGGFRFFDGGDVTWNVEATLTCPVVQTGPVDVFQVNHHGLDVSNNPLLLRALAPRVAVFNNGPRKGCHPSVVAALAALADPPTVFQVHSNQGAPGANTASERIANLASEGGEWIRLRVAADARSYTVEVPRSGHRATFAVR